VSRVILAVICFVVAGLLSALGPYADVRARMAPRSPLEERPAADVAEMRGVLEALGPAGRAAYRRQLGWDLIVIAANAGWTWVWLAAVGRRALPRSLSRRAPTVLAALPALADLAENGVLALMLSESAGVSPSRVALAAGVTHAKFVLFALAVGSAFLFTAVFLAKRIIALARRLES